MQDNQKQQNTDQNQNAAQSQQGSAGMLKDIVKNDVAKMTVPIINAPKIKNSVLRQLIEDLKKEKDINKDEIVEVLLLLDESVEAGLITEEELAKVNQDPNYLNELIK